MAKNISFNTVYGKHCCNLTACVLTAMNAGGFNTVNGRYCCNKVCDCEIPGNKT